jgi:aspartyl-tRNA(Asn)/glutamyl-tRNA(Gln) amidotransferase subunit A
MTAAELGRGIGRGEIDPVALTEAFLAAVEGGPAGIYARLTPDRALAEAGAAAERARNGRRRGPLDGVPLSWKDLVDSAGTATEAGSRLLAGRVPGADGAVLATATAGGGVCLGKTHLSELAFSGIGYNPMTATPPNIHDPALAPGGSSSGAAASVAFGLAAAAVGSDTGGSVRIPAAWNDLVGLKTTTGRLPLTGVVPLCERFDTIGPLTRTVEDAALMLGLLSGQAAPDLSGARLAGCRLAVLETAVLDDTEPQVTGAFDAARTRLEAAGARLERLTAPEVTQALALSGVLYTTEAYAIWGATIEAAPDAMFDRVRDRFRAGAGFSGTDYVAAWRQLRDFRDRWTARTAPFDAVLLPTSANLPPRIERLVGDPAYFVAQNLLTLRNTRVGNLMDLCALTLPTGVPSCGLSLMAPPGQEARLLRLGAAVERALAPH